MRILKIAILFCLMCSITTYSQNILIPRTIQKVNIDGNLSDWKTPFLGPFVVHDSGKKALQDTYVSFAWDTDNLYIAYRSIDSKIMGKAQQKDTEIFNTDDLVEIFIDPDGNGENYLEIGVNAYSSYYDLLLKCISPACGGWNMNIAFDVLGLETQSKITNEGFNTEIKIPFSNLNTIKNGNFSTPKVGTKWRGNAFRIDYGNTTEYLALQAYKSSRFGFHQPQEFAVFEFVE